MLSLILAALTVSTHSVTLTARSTGVEKGTPIEFVFAAKDSDRDYETLFLLEDSLEDVLKAFDKAGFPRGTVISATECKLWPSGVPISIKPALTDFLTTTPLDDGSLNPNFIYTGGERLKEGDKAVCLDIMPKALWALFDLPQSPIQYDGIFPQGTVYNHHLAKETLPKNKSYTFTLSWDGKTRVAQKEICIKPGTMPKVLAELKEQSQKSSLELLVSFDGDMTVEEAAQAAQALSVIDSTNVKINGRHNNDFFYRAFLPLVKWRDRQQRLTQPFEIRITNDAASNSEDQITYIAEDWSVEGNDPKLTPQTISFERAAQYPKTDTAFIFAPRLTKLGRIKPVIGKLPKSVKNIYVFAE